LSSTGGDTAKQFEKYHREPSAPVAGQHAMAVIDPADRIESDDRRRIDADYVESVNKPRHTGRVGRAHKGELVIDQ
jgi:hypothetical protein